MCVDDIKGSLSTAMRRAFFSEQYIYEKVCNEYCSISCPNVSRHGRVTHASNRTRRTSSHCTLVLIYMSWFLRKQGEPWIYPLCSRCPRKPKDKRLRTSLLRQAESRSGTPTLKTGISKGARKRNPRTRGGRV